MYDAVVIGGGPAGLTAGMYLARARYRTLIIEQADFGGQITITSEVVNYPGVPMTDGRKLTAAMRQQAQDFGAELRMGAVTGIDAQGDVKTVHTTRGDVQCFAIVLAMGAAPRKIGFEGEREYAGRGVAYCATCDGEFFTGKDVLVVGGGFAAAEESVLTVLVREDDFTCDAAVAQHAKDDPKITVRYGTELAGVTAGAKGLTEATLKDAHTGETSVWKPQDGGTFGVFVFAGYEPQTQIVRGVVELDGNGYVVTDDALRTSVPGVFAAGDLRVKDLRQVVTATADGAIAAVHAEEYAAAASKRTGITPQAPTATPYQRREEHSEDSAPAQTTPAPASNPGASADTEHPVSAVFTDDVVAHLNVVFARMERTVTLQLQLDRTELSHQLQSFIDELVSLSDGKLESISETVEELSANGRGAVDYDRPLPYATPMVRLMVRDDSGMLQSTGIAFHGVPTGHEFHSFVLGIYNAAGPGQPLIGDERERIEAIHDPVEIMLLVSLTCTMCPETVRAAQRIAALNSNVRAEAYDLAHFPELKERYDVMSVPCIVMRRHGRETIEFGKKNVSQMLDVLDAV